MNIYNIDKNIYLSLKDKYQILKLWNAEYPLKLNYSCIEEFDEYLNSLNQQRHYFYRDHDQNIRGWAITFERNQEPFFAIILDKSIQNIHLGTKLISFLKQEISQLNGWVIDNDKEIKLDGSFYKSPLKFYLGLDFKIVPDQRIDIKKLNAVKISWKK